MKKRLLLVEDDPEMRTYVAALLEQRGFEVKAVETGREALVAMRQAFFDLVVLDVLLPDTNGLDLSLQLKQSQPQAFLPILLLSSVADEAVIRRALETGADAYLAKPPAPVELVGRAMELLTEADQRNACFKHPAVA